MNRAVIPSKRAAQNRAAQKAFRQRQNIRVKELETKAKEMDQWKEETELIKNENRKLKALIHQLQVRISSLTGEPMPLSDQQQHRTACSPVMPSPGSPPDLSTTITHSSPPSLSPATPHLAPCSSYASSIRLSSSPPPPQATQLSSSLSLSPPSSNHSYSPIPLRPHSFVPSSIEAESMIPSSSSSSSSCSSSSSSSSSYIPNTISYAVNAGQTALIQSTSVPSPSQQHPLLGGGQAQIFDLDLDLDPFFDDDHGFPRMDDHLGFMGGNKNNSGQVLDDLFAVLQTRQRPQIPSQPHTADSPYYMMDFTGAPSS